MRTLSLLLLLGLAVVGAPPVAADDATPGSPDWEALDLEGKWITYRRAVKKEPKGKSAWLQWMAHSKDYDVLELVAVYDNWSAAGPLLADAGAPQWIRVAFWSLDDQRSHSFDNAAATLLASNPAEVLAWAKAHPEGVTTAGHAVLKRIRSQHKNVKPAETTEALPLLREAEVFAALSAPAKLTEFGSRTRAKPGEVYLHQVLRALRARVKHHPLNEAVRDQVMGLARHPHPAVRQRAVLALASLPPKLRPIAMLYYTACDEREPIGVREAAVLVAGKSGHPALQTWLFDLAYQPEHPLWIAALSQLVNRDEGFLLTDAEFDAVDPGDTARRSVLTTEVERLRKRWEKVPLHTRLASFFRRAAWMNKSGHVRARDYTRWALDAARRARTRGKVHKALMRLANDPKLADYVSFGPGAAQIPPPAVLRAEVQSLARRALQLPDSLREPVDPLK